MTGMTDPDLGGLTNLILPTIISGVIAFIILGLKRFTRASDDTIAHTVKVENIEIKLTGFDKKFEEISDNFKDIWKRLEELTSTIRVHDYRLDNLDSYSRDRDGYNRDRERQDRERDKHKRAPL